jgi:single-stranded DNA-binding protein
MNTCILVAEVIEDPQLRYTSDTQIEITEMLVQFEGLRQGDPPSTLKVVAWRSLATEVQQKYRQGDRLVIEGRLSMNTIERPEGYKEKRAELVAQKLYLWGSNEPAAGSTMNPAAPTAVPAATPAATPATAAPIPAPANPPRSESRPPSPSVSSPLVSYDEPLTDDIPF